MKLEAGKSYYRRDGEVESIVRTGQHKAFNANGRDWYIGSGQYLMYESHPWDLISEVPSADQAFSETAEAGLSAVTRTSQETYEAEIQFTDQQHLLIALCQKVFGATPTFKSHEQ